ncbi:ankyrin repeat-containing domain protein [Flagelloscypha sp. PMI_526]|nr:ankyrin repeat-containing domain protein [Flagelloscypha sp. PMI_526]
MAPVLVTATRRGCTRFLTAAVHGGADVHTTDAVNDETILQVASKEGHVEIVDLLLQHNADIKDIKPALLAPGNSNGSALHLAAARGFFEAVTLLIGSGAYPDLNLQAGEYDTALQAACDFSPPSNSEMMPADHFKVIHHLLQHGADPNSTIQNFPRALFCAARRNNLKAAKLLLECGADVNATNDLPGHSFGTAIHVAFRSGFSEMARLLLTNGAYLHKNPFYSATPMNSVITRSKSMPDLGRLMSRGEGRSRRASLI